jgi:hypothetical protein
MREHRESPGKFSFSATADPAQEGVREELVAAEELFE